MLGIEYSYLCEGGGGVWREGSVLCVCIYCLIFHTEKISLKTQTYRRQKMSKSNEKKSLYLKGMHRALSTPVSFCPV